MGHILGDQEQVYRVVFPAGRFHQTPVAQGKGVGVHDDGGLPAAAPLQPAEIALEAMGAVLHEDHLALHPGNLVKPQVPEDGEVAAFGVQEQMTVAPAVLIFHQVRDHGAQQSLAPVGPIHGKAAQRIAEAGAGGHQPLVPVIGAHGVVQVGVLVDAFLLQQAVPRSGGGGVPPIQLFECDVVHQNLPRLSA